MSNHVCHLLSPRDSPEHLAEGYRDFSLDNYQDDLGGLSWVDDLALRAACNYSNEDVMDDDNDETLQDSLHCDSDDRNEDQHKTGAFSDGSVHSNSDQHITSPLDDIDSIIGISRMDAQELRIACQAVDGHGSDNSHSSKHSTLHSISLPDRRQSLLAYAYSAGTSDDASFSSSKSSKASEYSDYNNDLVPHSDSDASDNEDTLLREAGIDHLCKYISSSTSDSTPNTHWLYILSISMDSS
ncbi:hypothetical protein NEOLEDRAFT_1184940 [Neolentinus lepideus HHB14362 ss-1]|uniref:Uncharacterized protein n=1 Tax=Neolentinus lepideus HHB14362 ss-1 TaxID=1314782 RepID=A0A165ISR7_9AGAM|nr:hypothetical protein NEOLEDRAFT_1184940 [Neolentinus lepideus HHB14362 ss-1]